MNEHNKIYTHVRKPEVSGIYEGQTVRFLSEVDENKFDTMISNVEQYIKNNNGFGKPEEEKDRLYSEAKTIVNAYSNALGNAKFNFYTTNKGFTIMKNFIEKEMEYNVENVFVGIEVNKFFEDISIDPRSPVVTIGMTPTEMTYVYHLISKKKTIGLRDETLMFANILTSFGYISTVIKYYDGEVKRLEEEVTEWVLLFEPNIKKDGAEKPVQVEQKVEEDKPKTEKQVKSTRTKKTK